MRQWAPTAWLLQLQAFRHYAAAAAPAISHTALIKQLRERSGSPITDVKSCLEASNWDLDAAYEALRKKGLAAAAKKASRHAAEGLVGCATAAGGRSAVVVEVNSETDFVARNDLFRSMVGQVAAAALEAPMTTTAGAGTVAEIPLEQVLHAPTVSGRTVTDAVAEVAAQVRENVRLRRAFKCSTATGAVSTYVHQSPAPGLGRIAVMVAIQPRAADSQPLTQSETQRVDEVGRQLAMHVAGMKPLYVSRAHVPSGVLERERDILKAHPSTAGKPPAVVAKVVEGRLSKFFEETVLLDQRFLLDDSSKVSAVVDRLSKALGKPLQVATFMRVQCGEGLEAQTKDFASEVASIVQETGTA